jgi:hypothetical protein
VLLASGTWWYLHINFTLCTPLLSCVYLIVGSATIMGFLGILEDKHLTHVPATVVLSEEQNPLTVTEGTAILGLKRGTGRDADIILIPQP